jgi:hypothetical protein
MTVSPLLKFTILNAALATALIAQNSNRAHGPWKLGMSFQEVQSVKEHGPYQRVQMTGGIETRNGIFDGEKRNVAFVFDSNGAVNKIQVWAYEGRSEAEALANWYRVYKYYAKIHPEVESTLLNLPPAVDEAEFTSRSRAFLATIPIRQQAKMQMAPRPMPADAKVFASFIRSNIMYLIFVNIMEP